MLAGKPVEVASADSLGCLINFPEQQARAQHASISYSKEIAPMLIGQLRVLSPRRWHWPVGDVRLQHGARLRADDA